MSSVFGSSKTKTENLTLDTEEEVFDCNESDEPFDQIISTLESIIFGNYLITNIFSSYQHKLDDSFSNFQNDFLEKYYQIFDETQEENKLEYTEVFKQYIATIEEYLGSKLKDQLPWFEMNAFNQMLMEKKGELEGEIFDVLEDLSDFTSFKDLILSYKAGKTGAFADLRI